MGWERQKFLWWKTFWYSQLCHTISVVLSWSFIRLTFFWVFYSKRRFCKNIKIGSQVFKKRGTGKYFSNCFLTFTLSLLVWYSILSLIRGHYGKSESFKLAIVIFCINYICIKQHRMKYKLSKSHLFMSFWPVWFKTLMLCFYFKKL